MKEFDKIYVAKYSDILTVRQISEDLGVKKQAVETVLENLKSTGLYEVYKDISDYEWDELEKKSDIEILNKYLSKIPGYHIQMFNKILEEFKEEQDYRYLFEMYKPEDYAF